MGDDAYPVRDPAHRQRENRGAHRRGARQARRQAHPAESPSTELNGIVRHKARWVVPAHPAPERSCRRPRGGSSCPGETVRYLGRQYRLRVLEADVATEPRIWAELVRGCRRSEPRLDQGTPVAEKSAASSYARSGRTQKITCPSELAPTYVAAYAFASRPWSCVRRPRGGEAATAASAASMDGSSRPTSRSSSTSWCTSWRTSGTRATTGSSWESVGRWLPDLRPTTQARLRELGPNLVW